MNDFDIFAALTGPGAAAGSISVHNVRLVDVQPDAEGWELLTISHAGSSRELIGGGPWRESFSRINVGKFGYVVPADAPRYAGSCYFREYVDQSLRRVPDLDCRDRITSTDGRVHEIVGWRCDDRPHGFHAPIGIIPGDGGRFVHDETVAVTLRVPPEFVRECKRVQKSPEELLCSFVGDLSGIQNYFSCPRADGYGSNGSDEREYADAWLQRAHGMDVIDLEALEAREEEVQEMQYRRDDFAALLDDFEHYGGKPTDLVAVVLALVDKQEKSQDEQDPS